MNFPETGVVAVSRAGHDKGKAFVIVGRAEPEHVLLADGESRTVAKPKKKKLRHLHVEPKVASEVREKLLAGTPVSDAEIRKALRASHHAFCSDATFRAPRNPPFSHPADSLMRRRPRTPHLPSISISN